MSEPTDAELAAWLRVCAEKLQPPRGYDWGRAPLIGTPAEQAQFFRLAAQRLEARGEITEAMVKAACLAHLNHPNGGAVSEGAMRVALESALTSASPTA